MIVVASLSAVPQLCRTLPAKKNRRSFTSIQMLHTHTHTNTHAHTQRHTCRRVDIEASTTDMKMGMKREMGVRG